MSLFLGDDLKVPSIAITRLYWLRTVLEAVSLRREKPSARDVAVTARHYATCAGGDEYRDPPRLQPREVPADLIARIESRHQSPHAPSGVG